MGLCGGKSTDRAVCGVDDVVALPASGFVCSLAGGRASEQRGLLVWPLSEFPSPGVAGEAEGKESAQVESGDSVVQPLVVLRRASVAEPAVTAGEPGDSAFDHRPVLSVFVLPRRIGGGAASHALELVVGPNGELFRF
ncbi:hypothetical protein SAMN06265360_13120 [Haloechinothrix alba]|uniref:Uncharacterized protein n=1 Tax=Haloechinothrix alba TaxID=664784 RepID=A0A239A878_9PSEU|nr:hypothetical protein SAMN06265360_13120 [Haloechinothrix alba]